MTDLSDGLADAIAKRLHLIHFDGQGCGTNGSNACSNCFGPSPMSADELAEDIAAEVRRHQAADASTVTEPKAFCLDCEEPLRFHHGNGGQWLGANPPRDWGTCYGTVDGPKHHARGTLVTVAPGQCCEQCVVDRAKRSRTSMTLTEQRRIQAAFERDRWAGEWNSLPTAIDNLLSERSLVQPGTLT